MNSYARDMVHSLKSHHWSYTTSICDGACTTLHYRQRSKDFWTVLRNMFLIPKTERKQPLALFRCCYKSSYRRPEFFNHIFFWSYPHQQEIPSVRSIRLTCTQHVLRGVLLFLIGRNYLQLNKNFQ